MNNLSPFHLAIPVDDLEVSREFYREILGFEEGRSSEQWVDFNFFGHQLVIHTQQKNNTSEIIFNSVDGKEVPVPHFGVVLSWAHFQAFADRLKKLKISFIIEPYVRFKDKTGEQMTMFFQDPSGNALEFKAFKNNEQLFKK